MARDLRAFIWVFAAGCALAACDTPTWVVLRPKCAAGDGSTGDGSCEDAGSSASVMAKCSKDAQCAAGELCVLGDCRACDPKPACPGCAAGSTQVTSSVNGCLVCSCAPMTCKTHEECPIETVCEGNQCVPCAAASARTCPASCPWSWKAQPFTRNRCALCECAPPPGCQSDGDCGAGLHCYRGQHCRQGCSDLACCFGNFCSPPGCDDAPALSCSLVGCADGRCAGDESCGAPACKCDGKTFECSADCTGAFCKL